MFTKEFLNECFDYISGDLYWKERPRHHFLSDKEHRRINSRFSGLCAGSTGGDGYLSIWIRGRSYKAHRLIWAYHYGSIADKREIDHIDGDRKNNRIENLRLVLQADNMRNKRPSKKNSSGVVGVVWEKRRQLWRAQICFNYKAMSVGRFKNFDDAVNARKEAERKYGFHKNHGIKPTGK